MALLRRYTGTITKFNQQRGFGFVHVDGPFPQAFVQAHAFPPYIGMHLLGPGTRIEFYLEHGPRGLKAIRANVI